MPNRQCGYRGREPAERGDLGELVVVEHLEDGVVEVEAEVARVPLDLDLEGAEVVGEVVLVVRDRHRVYLRFRLSGSCRKAIPVASSHGHRHRSSRSLGEAGGMPHLRGTTSLLRRWREQGRLDVQPGHVRDVDDAEGFPFTEDDRRSVPPRSWRPSRGASTGSSIRRRSCGSRTGRTDGGSSRRGIARRSSGHPRWVAGPPSISTRIQRPRPRNSLIDSKMPSLLRISERARLGTSSNASSSSR